MSELDHIDPRSLPVAVALHRLVGAQRVVKRKGYLFVACMGCRPLGRSDFLAARTDWLGHTLRHSRLVAVRDHWSAPGARKSLQQSYFLRDSVYLKPC